MGEYRIILPKTQQGGFASDPEQGISNSGSPLLDKPLTIQNGALIMLAYSQGKKIANTVFTAAVDQIGDSRVEVATIVGQKVGKYVAIGVVTGGTGILIMGGAEVATTALTFTLESHSIALENEMKIIERGVRRSFGVSYYD